ncbi:cytochrome P450 71A1-like [Neltuma alba]|uniref:cytochrome P450 71A1-like n=1 Tax=Neltuma alba TaxID=207710 RepID=UPI0010A4B3C3|nr:cytochrome P450 71A1-like [Prosopis alba]XP_028785722.1 cytochrome P450 71A1-like [Prosopis alba]
MAAMELNQNLYLSFFWCLIFIVLAFKLTRKRTKPNFPPSPPKLPIIGNLHQISTPFHQSLRSLSSKYGPLMLLHLGQVPTVVVSSADLAREMAKTSNDIVFSSRRSITAAKILFYGCNDVISAPYGEGWKLRRKISITEFLSPRKVKSFQYISEEEVSNLVNKIRDEARNSKNDGLPVSVNLIQMLIETLNNVLCRCIFGHKCETSDGESSRLREIMMEMMHEFGEFSFGDFFPSLWWMDCFKGLIPKMKATSKELEALILHEIEQHKSKRRNNTHENKDLLDILLELQQNGIIRSDLSLVSIKAIIVNMFAAGIDTTSTTMEWAMAEMMKHAEKMKRAQEEVRGIVGYKTRIDETDVNQMRYLKCVVKETLRLHPAGLIPRETNNSVKLGGHDIPPKTNILVNPFAIHRDPNHWERPEEFVPERFENSEVDFKGQDFEFIPFGFGRRGCPGLYFGVASVEYTLANLLYWFDWKFPDDDGTAMTYGKDIDMSEADGQAIRKKIQLLLHPIPYSFCPKT